MGRRRDEGFRAVLWAVLIAGCASGPSGAPEARANRGRAPTSTDGVEGRSPATAANTSLASQSSDTGDGGIADTAEIIHPCEAVCGRVGDCLLADPSKPRGGAGKLEMACIGMCLDGDERHQTKLAGCAGEREVCGDYLSCVGANWATRAKPAPQLVRSREMQCGDVCDLGDCFLEMWMSAGAHLDPAELDQQRRAYEEFVERVCVQGCIENATDADIEVAERCNAMSCSDRLQCVMSKEFIVL